MTLNKTTLAGLACIALLAGCDSSSDSDDDNTITTRSIDASSYSDTVYYQLDDLLAAPLTITDPGTDTRWDIGFKRDKIILNGGDSGSGSVEGALAAAQDSFYNTDGTPNESVFLNATAAQEGKTAFDSVTSAAELTGYLADTNTSAIASADWWSYNPATHAVSVKSDKGWIVRSSTGDSYARVYVSALAPAAPPSRNLGSVTLNIAVQGSGETAFAAATDEVINFNDVVVCYDFDSKSTADCTGNSWDLRIDPTGSYTIWLNGPIHGGGQGAIAFGEAQPVAGQSALYTPPSVIPRWIPDGVTGIFSENSWYFYEPSQHKLWPNYRVYVLKEGNKRYKLQVQSYYNSDGTSGHLSVAVEALPDVEDTAQSQTNPHP
ncbi:MAG: hypothetical protein CSA54_01495 [Gammaproteobacteria bacterium]|nr:MAG: hypothetical protein CSA54_01495 [Gammaproteobacteria bacterium]